MQQAHLGILGGGTVGGGVFQAIRRNGGLMASRLGIGFKVVGVAVRDLDKTRAVRIPANKLTTDWKALVAHPKVNLILELMGGVTQAKEAVIMALKLGKPVVTANKALLSAHGEELFALAKMHQANIYYEASVAGGIPIIKALREGLIGNRIDSLHGILNGTCNYILTRMTREGGDFDVILQDAQRLGYAEADPSLDVDGLDAMHKTGLLASLAYGFWVHPDQIYVEGIRKITSDDLVFAGQLGYTVKLLAIVKCPIADQRRPRVRVSVCPTLIPKHHVLAGVNDVYNAVYIRGDVVGETLYYGHGAGQNATASAVLSDLADAALDIKHGTKNRIPPFVPHEKEGGVQPWEDVVSRFYVRFQVIDRPGTLASIAQILAKAGIGISSVIQPEGHGGKYVPLILMIHDASNRAMDQALALIRRLPVVKGNPILIRVESFD